MKRDQAAIRKARLMMGWRLCMKREDYAIGLARPLSLALRVLTLVEYVAREQLQQAKETPKGLYAGNPQHQTDRPTTERLLKAFRGITLTIVQLSEQTIYWEVFDA